MDYQKELNLPFPLRDYQKNGVKFLTSNSSALLGDDMGLGKHSSNCSLKIFIKRFLVFNCCTKLIKTNWLNEFKIWFPDAVVTDLTGDLENRSYTLETYNGFVICTYEQLRSSFDVNHRIPSLILSFMMKSRSKKFSSQVYMSAYGVIAEKVWAISGTPLENTKYTNIFNLIKVD